LPTGSTDVERLVYQGTCTVILALQNTDGIGSMSFELADSFDSVYNKLFPPTEPETRLDARQNFLFTLRGGQRIMLVPQDIRVIVEDEE